MKKSRREPLPKHPNERPILRALFEAPDGTQHLWTVISSWSPTDAEAQAGVAASASHCFPAMGCKLISAERIIDATWEL